MSRKIIKHKLPSLRVALKAPRSNLRDYQAWLDVTEIASSGKALLAMTGLEEAK